MDTLQKMEAFADSVDHSGPKQTAAVIRDPSRYSGTDTPFSG